MATIPYGYSEVVNEDSAATREALVLAHLPQVRLIARRIHGRLPSNISLDDLISTGVVGLLAAIDNFNPGLNIQLNTYAEHRIRGAIMDGLREMDWAPRETRKRSKLIEGAIRQAEQGMGRAPTEEEIAAVLGIPLTQYHEWLGEVRSVELQSLECASGDGSGGSLLQFISDDEDYWPSHLVERSELERILALAIERMPKAERTVLSLYYYEELNLREIAEVMGMHLSRIGQLKAGAILRLRSHLHRVWLSRPKELHDQYETQLS
jgi:RNA polymerase sigma factor for flagellar operon FliA